MSPAQNRFIEIYMDRRKVSEREGEALGHHGLIDRVYGKLQQRLDRTLTGAPDAPVFRQILALLFSQEEAEIACHIPTRFIAVNILAVNLNMPRELLEEKLSAMAEKGLVFDFVYEGSRCVALAPVVIGFFEFVFMRNRDDLPMAELARLFECYMMEDDRFARSVFEGQTALGRAMVREESLDEIGITEIMDWEKATRVVEQAEHVAVSLCACRHKAEHLGKACRAPQEVCLTLNGGAVILAKQGLVRMISTTEALKILEISKRAGLVQVADNIQREVGFICNCCSCCCGMFQAMRRFDLRQAVATSGWTAQVNSGRCCGCGRCVDVCPVGALGLEKGTGGGNEQLTVDEICLGCGVCQQVCPSAALFMERSKVRVLPPETTFDRMALMALERGKISDFLFQDGESLGYRAIGRLVSLIERSWLVRKITDTEMARSIFLNRVLKPFRQESEKIQRYK